MSILIKGMEMPKRCAYCPMLEGDRDDGLCHAASRWLDDDEYWLWYQYPEGDIDTSKPSNCPLIELPPHGRLIDADAFYEVLDGGYDLDFDELPETKRELLRMITDAPTIIEAEVDDG